MCHVIYKFTKKSREKGMQNIEVIKKAVALLGYMSRDSGAVGVSELSRTLSMPKTTVHRILSTLCGDNVVTKTDKGFYKIGPTVLLWSGGYKFSSGIITIARPWLEKLRDESQETIHLSVFEHGVARYAERLDSPQTVVLRWSRLGMPLPLYCTAAGRAILAALPMEELDAYLSATTMEPRTTNTVTRPAELKKMLARFRIRGYAEEVEENEENIRCVGAAIVNSRGYPIGAISLTAPFFRFTDEDGAKMGALLAAAADEISQKIS